MLCRRPPIVGVFSVLSGMPDKGVAGFVAPQDESGFVLSSRARLVSGVIEMRGRGRAAELRPTTSLRVPGRRDDSGQARLA
jgi:hypothetical protein